MIPVSELLPVNDVFFIQEFTETCELFVAGVEGCAVGAVEGAEEVGVVGAEFGGGLVGVGWGGGGVWEGEGWEEGGRVWRFGFGFGFVPVFAEFVFPFRGRYSLVFVICAFVGIVAVGIALGRW